MKSIPFRSEKIEWLARIFKVCPVTKIEFDQEANFAKMRLRHSELAPLNNEELLTKLRIDPHHRLHDSDENIKKYPLQIHSLWNLVPIYHEGHDENRNFWPVNDEMARERERFLEANPEISKFMNTVQGTDYIQDLVKEMILLSIEEARELWKPTR